MTLTTVPSSIEADTAAQLARIGYGNELAHAGTCLIVDQHVSRVKVTDPDVVVLPLAEALETYDWVQDLVFGLIDPKENEHIAEVTAGTEPPLGHFVWVKPGAKVALPIQLFDLISHPHGRQYLHSVTVIDEGAEVDIVSGSTVPANVRSGRHISISETYLRAGAACRSVSVEAWGEGMEVHDYAQSQIGEGATSIATTIQMSNVGLHHSQATTTIETDGTDTSQTILFSPEGTKRILDSTIVLAGENANAESIARMVAAGGEIINRSTLVGDGENSKGYLGCDGLKLDNRGQIHSAPALVANASSSQLSHEASIGVIGAEKIAYLQASGLNEEAARDLLIQGFLNLDESLIPEGVRDEVTHMVATAKSGAL